MWTRRELMARGTAWGAAAACAGLLPRWAHSWAEPSAVGLTRSQFDLDVGHKAIAIDGREGKAVTINGTVPGPLLRWREGESVVLNVTNHLGADTSIHWHGILLPPEMDGVPGVSFPGIRPGETFRYHFPVRQAGTYWYHSHSGLQEQLGHYGPLVIDPMGPDPVGYDREHILVLSDWTFENPHRVFAKLKAHSDVYDFQRLTARDFARDVRERGWRAAWRERRMWGSMRMSPTDLADVTGATYTYLLNGHGPVDHWSGLFEVGERVRLRIINASAMSIFNVRIPGLPMTVVQADGLDVQPVGVDEFQIGTAETYDVVVEPREDRPFALMAESIDRSGYAMGSLTPEMGLQAEAAAVRERPLLTMRDMGMAHHGDHGGGGASVHREPPKGHRHHRSGSEHQDGAAHGAERERGSEGQDAASEAAAESHGKHGAHHEPEAHRPQTEHSAHHGVEPVRSVASTAAEPLQRGPGVANVAEAPQSRTDEPGIGLDDVPHRVLRYSDLASLDANPDHRPPQRELELHLTSNMERYMWSFDGVKFSEAPDPIVFHEGERLRLTMINDTMMPHPIHLHGMFFELVNGEGHHKPRKHTVVVKPGEKLSIDVTADAVGDWAFHCHLLYHMHAGMMRVVSVRPHGAVS